MNAKSQYPTTFPFLSLPRELQAEVVRHVGDIVALRDLLAIPQVARSVAPFLRLVTNDEEHTHWFTGLEKYVKCVDQHELPTDTIETYGPIYILDLFVSPGFHHSSYLSLRRPIVVLTVADRHFEDFSHIANTTIRTFSKDLCIETMGIVGYTGRCKIVLVPEPALPTNVTLVDCGQVVLAQPLDHMKSGAGMARSVMVRGSLLALKIEGFPPSKDATGMRSVYKHFSELIRGAERLTVEPFSASASGEEDDAQTIALDGWDIPMVNKLHEFQQCRQFTNANINTSYTDKTADSFRDGELFLDMLYYPEEGEENEEPILTVIKNVVAPGLHKLRINVSGPFFPSLSMVWLPHLDVLKLTGYYGWDWEMEKIGFGHLETVGQMQDLSRLVYPVKELYVDQFTAPILGFVLPSSFMNLTSLTLRDDVFASEYSAEVASTLERLKLRHGKISMPKLKQLRWSSIIHDQKRVLEFANLSKWFSFPRLKKLLFEAGDAHVSLKAIAHQLPKIKEIEISSGDDPDFGDSIYPTPERHLPYTTFEKLERLVIHTGHHTSMFDAIRFPHLKCLDLTVDVDELIRGNLEADMPVLESMLIRTDAVVGNQTSLNVSGFESLKIFTLTSDHIEVLSLQGSLNLERILHTGKALARFYIGPWGAARSLKALKYTSLDQKPCHNFTLSPSVHVDIS